MPLYESHRPAGPGPGKERRRLPRYPTRVEGTAWSVTRVAVDPFNVMVTDISLEGMMLHTAAEELGRFQVGDDLLLGFPHPTPDNQVRLRGQVVWKRRGVMNLLGSWTFGVEFHDTPEPEIRKLLDPAARGQTPLPDR
jgi:hypothetical protein